MVCTGNIKMPIGSTYAISISALGSFGAQNNCNKKKIDGQCRLHFSVENAITHSTVGTVELKLSTFFSLNSIKDKHETSPYHLSYIFGYVYPREVSFNQKALLLKRQAWLNVLKRR